MKLLSTKRYGDPDAWLIPQAIVAQTIWQIAEETYKEELLTADIRYTFGRGVAFMDVCVACKNIPAPYLCNAVTFLLKRGVIETKEELEWETLYLTSDFIEGQQEAYHEQIARTNRLADILLKLNHTYLQTVNLLPTQPTYEQQIIKQKQVAVMITQLERLQLRAKRWQDCHLIDGQLWQTRLLEALKHVRQPAPARSYAY